MRVCVLFTSFDSAPLFIVNWLEANMLLLGEEHPSEVTDSEKC